MARPRVLGVDTLFVRRLQRDDRLEELQITFADAGSSFGYLDRSIPNGMNREKAMIRSDTLRWLFNVHLSGCYRKVARNAWNSVPAATPWSELRIKIEFIKSKIPVCGTV